MGLDCRELLDVKEYEFLLNWFMRQQKQHQLAQLEDPIVTMVILCMIRKLIN